MEMLVSVKRIMRGARAYLASSRSCYTSSAACLVVPPLFMWSIFVHLWGSNSKVCTRAHTRIYVIALPWRGSCTLWSQVCISVSFLNFLTPKPTARHFEWHAWDERYIIYLGILYSIGPFPAHGTDVDDVLYLFVQKQNNISPFPLHRCLLVCLSCACACVCVRACACACCWRRSKMKTSPTLCTWRCSTVTLGGACW
jgi:hypothetical protein